MKFNSNVSDFILFYLINLSGPKGDSALLIRLKKAKAAAQTGE
jgi:hypothetical protein